MSDTSASSIRPSGELPVSEQDVRAELERLLADSNFRATDRNRRFLRYVTEKLLEGNAHRIKAYSIAVDVFGRPGDFDPALDPIVRIEATRLRASLAHYYEAHAAARELRIELPKGRYLPTISRRRVAEPALPFSEKPRLLILLAVGEAGVAALGQEVREALTIAVSQFQTVRLLTDLTEEEASPAAGTPEPARVGAFKLLLTVRTAGNRSLLCWQLLDLQTCEVMASRREIIGEEADCIALLSNRIAGWQGLINNRELRRDLTAPTLGHGCLLRAFHALRTGKAEARERTMRELQAGMEVRPGDAEARAALSLLLLASDTGTDDEPQRALDLAESAVALAPDSALAARAHMTALARLKQEEAARFAGRRALALNPNDRELLAAVGKLLCLAGRWDEGVPFLEKAGNLEEPADLQSALALSAWHRGALAEARMHLQQRCLEPAFQTA